MTLMGAWLRRSALFRQLQRRARWLPTLPGMPALANLAGNALAFATSGRRAAALPSMVKIDITPHCALACPTCVHADPAGRNKPLLAAQVFDPKARMDLGHFTQLVQQIKGRALAVSLSYYGDPLMHPQLDQLIRVAADAGLPVHITTHFSYV